MQKKLAHYQIDDMLGEGSFAWVYRAFDEKFERPVALKVLKPMWLSDPQAIARFKQEAKTMAKLRHAHIVDVYDVGEAEGQIYLAQLLVEGETLADRLTTSSLRWDEVMKIVTDIGSALDYAHNQGIIHRDIKPQNILLDKENQAYLSDFGLVRAVEGSTQLTSSGTITGTFHYMAPEVWRGKKATSATDVYALSCVVSEMLTGERLFEGSSMAELTTLHVVEGPRLPGSWPAGVPVGVTDVLQRGLTIDPAERTSNAGELAAQLTALSASAKPASPRPVVVPTESVTDQPAKNGPSWLLIGGVVVMLLIIAAIAFFSLSGGDTLTSTPTEVATVVPTEEAPVEEAPAEVETSIVTELDTLTPTPTEVATVVPTEEAPAEETSAEVDTSGVTELNILWAQWDPADYLQQLVKDYEAETGVKVNVIQEPWGSFEDRFFTEMATGGDAWDMVVGRSQWLGQGAARGHYVDLTDFLVTEGMAESVAPATLTYYGEYPTGSGNYWAFPTEGDGHGWAYRKDLFEDPDNMATFEAKYGYALNVPKTFDELMDIAEFFTRPEEGLYGVAIYTLKDYDAITTGVQNTIFSFGADWKDPATSQVEGVLNSPEGVASLEYYRELYDCCQAPALGNAYFVETNNDFVGGTAAMAMNYFAFFPALADPSLNPYAETTGYFPNPAGPGGESYATMGGQATSIISYISPERQEAAKDFLRWFAQDDVQAKWSTLGGGTCNTKVLKSPEFLELTPFNPAFAETMVKVKDFWNIPEYSQLLEVTQREFFGYVVEGVGTAQEAMDNIATAHDQILRDAGYIQ